MNKVIFEAMRHARAMAHYLWLGLFTAWAIAVVGAIVVFLIPKKYEASARIFVNTESILKPLMVGMAVQPDTNQRVALLSKVIISRPNVERLIHETGMDIKAKTAEQHERLVDDVMKVLSIQGSGAHDNIYTLKFRDTSPERARRMIELLLTKFISTGQRTDTDAAKQFLDEQATTYEKRLQEAENRLKEFKLQNMVGLASGESKDQVTQLAAVGAQLEDAKLQLREAENSRDALRRSLHGESSEATGAIAPAAASQTGAITLAQPVEELDTRIATVQRDLDSLLQRYTENHPDVIGARRLLRELKEQRRKAAAQYGKGAVMLTEVAAAGGRASEQLKVSLAQAEANVASLRVRVAEYGGRYANLREAVRRMPEYEAQLAQLTRDYEMNKKNYENLAARRESANIADDMLSVSGVADFRLIDPPRVSPNAVSVPKSLMLLATIVLALAIGGGVMFLAKEIRGRFYDSIQLQEVTSLPILGMVSMVVNDNMRAASRAHSRRLLRTAAIMLVTYFIVVVTAFLLTKSIA